MVSRGRPCILVVDDDVSVRSLIRRFLERDGYLVMEAGNGREALERCRNKTFEMILTDWDMAEMGGGEFLAHLTGFNPQPPVLVVTGHPGLIPPEWQCLRKPFHFDELLSRVRAVCRG